MTKNTFRIVFLGAVIVLISLVLNQRLMLDDNSSIINTVIHDSKKREFLVHLPSSYHEKQVNYPVVIAFHGAMGSASQFADVSQLSQYADKNDFIVVYPEGLPNPVRTWNAGKCCGANAQDRLNTDDVGFVSKLIEFLNENYRINEDRIYAAGQSNGGMFCYRLLCELSDKIAAIAVNASGDVFTQSCPGLQNRSILHVHSYHDELIPIEGKPTSRFRPETSPLEVTLKKWSALMGCKNEPVLIKEEQLFQAFSYQDCSQGVEFSYYLTTDGGHNWPGGRRRRFLRSNPSEAFSMNELMWSFFESQSLKLKR